MKKLSLIPTTAIILMFSSLTSMAQVKTSIPNEIHLLQHPFKPMNILIKPAAIEGITAQPGDLVMAFAGEVCAGAAIVEDIDLILNLVATSNDEVNKGYKSGQTIRLEYHSPSSNTVFDLIPTKILMGSMNYEELGTLYAEFKANALSVEEIENTPEIKVYPNPVSQQLHIVLEGNQISSNKPIDLKLIDLSGRVVINKEVAGNSSVINLDVAQLLPGEYTLVLTSQKLKFTQKVIKK